MKGKHVKTGSANTYRCNKLLPGSVSGTFVKGDSSYCSFVFESYEALSDADEAMAKLSARITSALQQRTMVKQTDSFLARNTISRTSLAEMNGGGFYGYRILIDIVKNEAEPVKKYNLQLKIIGGKGILYQLIYSHEPVRSTLFTQTFQKMFNQFDDAETYYCNELLPGFECSTIDSAGRKQLLMEKEVTDFPDARVAFEALTSNLRANLGVKFLYYVAGSKSGIEKKIVFIHGNDFDKMERKSISAYLDRSRSGGYLVGVLMYHP